jgi:hypothetical protein
VSGVLNGNSIDFDLITEYNCLEAKHNELEIRSDKVGVENEPRLQRLIHSELMIKSN